MGTLLYLLMSVALAYWTGLFWWKAGRWAYLHGKDTRQRAVRFKDAVSSAMTSDRACGKE
jgi:hypothetical protein